ncbi:hypothetical protein EQG49_01650 [Periweissella cryptocerci]|uniref:Uncharacterized protein n=1 Tax=Periweissella cryptocerci TaxID=2506420 RepID=A0A4P6YRJ1_9LACO|nr:hypothetical protein [Periweissella cryptocerci]QBO35254.1 hypothetical protein EQG49_01650 [Periweissella cryptocerci]
MFKKVRIYVVAFLMLAMLFADVGNSVSAATTTKYVTAQVIKTKATKYHLWLHGSNIHKYKIVKSRVGKKHHKHNVYQYKPVGKRVNGAWGKRTITTRKQVILRNKKGQQVKLYYFSGMKGYVLAKNLKSGGYVAPPKKPTVQPTPVDPPVIISDAAQTAMNVINAAPIKTAAQLQAQMTQMNSEGFSMDTKSLAKLDIKLLGLNLQHLETLVKQEALAQKFIADGGTIRVEAPDSSTFESNDTEAQTITNFGAANKTITIQLNPDSFISDNVASEMDTMAAESNTYRTFKFSDGVSLYTTYSVHVSAKMLPIYVTTHEFGHLLQFIYMTATGDYNFTKVITSMRNKYIAATSKTAADYAAGISAYGYTSDADEFAESYASYRLGAVTPQNKYVAEEIANWVKLAYGN